MLARFFLTNTNYQKAELLHPVDVLPFYALFGIVSLNILSVGAWSSDVLRFTLYCLPPPRSFLGYFNWDVVLVEKLAISPSERPDFMSRVRLF